MGVTCIYCARDMRQPRGCNGPPEPLSASAPCSVPQSRWARDNGDTGAPQIKQTDAERCGRLFGFERRDPALDSPAQGSGGLGPFLARPLPQNRSGGKHAALPPILTAHQFAVHGDDAVWLRHKGAPIASASSTFWLCRCSLPRAIGPVSVSRPDNVLNHAHI